MNNIKTLFLHPFQDSAVSLGNGNIVKSLDKIFSLYLLKQKSYHFVFDKAKIYTLPNNFLFKSIYSILLSWKLLFSMDLLIGNGNLKEVPIVWLAKLLRPKIKYVFFIHTCYERFGQHKKAKGIMRLLYYSYAYLLSKADRVIAISDFSKKGFVKHMNLDPNKVDVVYNSVDTAFFNPTKKDVTFFKKFYGISNTKKNVLYLSKFTQTKRAQLIPKIAKLLPQYNFIMHGRNEMGLYFNDVKNIYSTEERPPREDIPKLFASADLFIFASEVEPCAAVITEAMASGLPLVASRGGSVPDQVLEGKNAILIDIRQGEISTFAKAIEPLLSNDAQRKAFSIASRKRSLDFDRLKIGKQYDKSFMKCWD